MLPISRMIEYKIFDFQAFDCAIILYNYAKTNRITKYSIIFTRNEPLTLCVSIKFKNKIRPSKVNTIFHGEKPQLKTSILFLC